MSAASKSPGKSPHPHAGPEKKNDRLFTLGIEEEFQIIDPVTRELRSHIEQIIDRKSTRLNSSHLVISDAVFCFIKIKNLVLDFSRSDYFGRWVLALFVTLWR